MDLTLLRARLRATRERLKISQETMAAGLALANRQAYSDIEAGDRSITSEELVAAAKVLGTTVYSLTDPLQLAGEGSFSWRQKGVDPAELDSFEFKAGQWIAAYRYFGNLRDGSVHSKVLRIALTHQSTFEEAQSQGENVAKALELGEIPAVKLASVLENTLSTLVLYVDAIRGVSGAACQLEVLNTIVVNRNEISTRRNYDIAHELFHLLTWQTMPPRRIDEASTGDKNYKRIEQLAENFAAGLLMPSKTIQAIVEKNAIPHEVGLAGWISSVASSMQVSATAMLWRLVNLRLVAKTTAQRLAESGALALARSSESDERPPLFSKRYMEAIAWAIDNGELSARRAAKLLSLTLEELSCVFKSHKVDCPYEL